MKYITFKDELTDERITCYVNVKEIKQINISTIDNNINILTNDDEFMVKITYTTPEAAVKDILESSPEGITTIVQLG